jgi:hypothetical protein
MEKTPMTIKTVLSALVLATLASTAALANDAPAAAAPAAPAAATEKCDITKEGKTATVEVAVGTCEKEGGKLAAPAAEAPKAEEKK